jgi:tetratricopeptide (TPR) repeat protein
MEETIVKNHGSRDRARWRWQEGILVAVWAILPLAYDRGVADCYQLPKAWWFAAASAALPTGVLLARWLKRKPVDLPLQGCLLVAFLLLTLVSASQASSVTLAAAPILRFATYGGFWFLGTLWLSGGQSLRPVFLGLTIQGVVVSSLALGQKYGIERWDQVAAFLGLEASSLPVSFAPWERIREACSGFFPAILGPRYDFPGREGIRLFELLPPSVDPPGSLAGHVNPAAEMALMGLLGSMGLLERRGARQASALARFALVIPFVLVQGFFVYVAGSRAVWLALLLVAGLRLGFAVLNWFRSQNSVGFSRARLLTACGLLVALVALDSVVTIPGRGGQPAKRPSERLWTLVDFSSGSEKERISLWRNSAEMVREAPLLGVGPGHWKIEYPRFARSALPHEGDRFSLGRQPERAHNEPLQLLAETGVVGFSLVALLLMLSSVALLRSGPNAFSRRAAFDIVLSLVVLSLFAFPLQLACTGSLFFLLLGSGSGTTGPLALRLEGRAVLGFALAYGAVVGLALFAQGQAWDGQRKAWLARHDQAAARHTGADFGAPGLGPTELRLRSLRGFDEAVAHEPTNYRLLMDRSRLYWEMGDGDEALRDLERVRKLHPFLVQAMLLEAELRQKRGAPEDSLAVETLLQVAARTMPTSPEVLLARGLWLLKRRPGEDSVPDSRRVEARFQLERAVENREYIPEGRLLLAELLLDLGAEATEVVPHLERAAENAARSPALTLQVARAFADPRLAAAAPGLLGPEGARSRSLWTRALSLAQGQLPEAEVELRMPIVERALKQGGELPSESQLQALLTRVQAWSQIDPRSAYPLRHAALIYEALGQHRQAMSSWGALLRALGRGEASQVLGNRMASEALQARERMQGGENPEPGR